MRLLVWQERPTHRMLMNEPIEVGDRLTLRDPDSELFTIMLLDDDEAAEYPNPSLTAEVSA